LVSTGQIFMKFDIWVFFKDLSRKFKFHYYTKRITSMIHEDLWTIMTISHAILLRISEVSDRSWRENQHILFFITFSKNHIMRKCGTIWYSQTGQWWETVWRMGIPCWTTEATDTLRICNTYSFSMATNVTRTCLNVLYTHYLVL
jgi:hypothetical protein